MQDKVRKDSLLSAITSREEALKVVRDASTAFLIIAAIQVALSFVFGFSIIFDAVVYGVGGFVLRRYDSRIAASILLLLALGEAGVTFANMVGAKLGGGANGYLAVILVLAAVRALEATFKLHGRFAHKPAAGEPPRT
jgi:ABC-type multidrug transport system permease subunit